MANKNIKKRFRAYGFKNSWFLRPGKRNTIADVRGVTVGHATKVKGKNIRTGVTIIDPGVKNLYTQKIPAAVAIGNGTGKIVGNTQIDELGTLEAPIALTNTLAVGTVTQAMIKIVLSKNKRIPPFATVNAFVGECNDGILNEIHKVSITEADVFQAYRNRSVQFAFGNVGAGTGTRAFSWKGGIGSSSREVLIDRKTYTIGVLVQTNYGGALTMLGVPIGKILRKTDYAGIVPDTDGSCMVVLATDAPLTARQLKRVAQRAFMGLARTGTVMRTVSGDYAIAFSTSRVGLEGSGTVGKCLKDDDLTTMFLGASEAVEESVYDALFAADTMRGRGGNVLEAFPIEKAIPLLRDN